MSVMAEIMLRKSREEHYNDRRGSGSGSGSVFREWEALIPAYF